MNTSPSSDLRRPKPCAQIGGCEWRHTSHYNPASTGQRFDTVELHGCGVMILKIDFTDGKYVDPVITSYSGAETFTRSLVAEAARFLEGATL